jgi:acryloyl-coenzyme A reductase
MSRVIGARMRLTEAGWDRDLVREVIAEPVEAPTSRDVVVEIEACGICHRDLIDRAGRFPFQCFPVTPGHEAVGKVVARGPDVRDFEVGDRVATMHRDACGECPRCIEGDTSLCQSAARLFGITVDGGYARHVRAHESSLYPVPKALPAPEAAVLHCTFGTAYRDLVTLGQIQKGERVLITGANGGVGSAAVQIAARLGAEVIAAVRDERHVDKLTAAGAHRVLVDRDGKLHEKIGDRADLALDTVGAATFLSVLRCLRTGGRAVVVGNIAHEKVALNLGLLITYGLRVIGGSGATRREMREFLALHESRPFNVQIDSVLSLRLADSGQRRVREGGLHGRIVLIPEVDS